MKLAHAQILLQARLRDVTQSVVGMAWTALPAHDHENVDEWMSTVLPLVASAQRQSAHLTEAYLGRALGRQAIGVDVEDLVGAAVRNGASPEEVYMRPFITTWAALGAGKSLTDALNAGQARATSAAAMDVQLTQRATFGAVQSADQRIRGYQRVADGDACDFCAEIDGAFVKSADAMALHNHCGCGLEPITDEPVSASPLPDTVAVHTHGELGLVLAGPGDHFTTEHQLH